MKIKLSELKANILLLAYLAMLISKLLVYLEEGAVKGRIFDILSWGLLLICIFLYNRDISIKHFDSTSLVLIVGILAWMVWAYFYGAMFSILNEFVPRFFLQSLPFYLDILVFSNIVINSNLTGKFIKINLFTIGAFLFWRYCINFDGIDFIRVIGNFWSSNQSVRYRNAYGLYHANATGTLCYTYLVLFVLDTYYKGSYEKTNNLVEKIFYSIECVLLVIVFIMLLSTGSRNSLICALLFPVLFLTIRYFSRIHTIERHVQVAVGIILVALLAIRLNFSSFLEQSNRLSNFSNLNLLSKYDKWITGLGISDSGNFISGVLPLLGTTYLDNFYLWVLLTTGIIGCILLLIPVGYFTVSMVSKSLRETPFFASVTAALLVAIFSAFFETNLIYPTFISSMINWIIFISVCSATASTDS